MNLILNDPSIKVKSGSVKANEVLESQGRAIVANGIFRSGSWSLKQVRGFAPIGMLECWVLGYCNVGSMAILVLTQI
jgi:hypothetical protein